jgi:outer membrane protein assembly factor BamB
VGPQEYSVEWELPLPGFPGSPAIGADGTIYITTGGAFEEGAGCFLYAVNPDGTVKWRFELPGPPASTAPAIGPDGTIYVHSQGVDMEGEGCGKYMIASVHYIQGIDPGGSLRCQFPLNGGYPMFASSVMSAPAVGPDGTIYVGDTDTALYALNPDCTLKWAVSPSLSSIDSSPAVASDGTVYIVDGCSHLYAYTPDGDLKWSAPLFDTNEHDVLCGANEQSPAIGEDGTIYVQGTDEDLYAITPSGTLRCKFETFFSSSLTPAIAADGTVHLSTSLSIDEAGLFAINPDCSLKWEFLPPWGVGGGTDGSPVIGADGTIYWRADWLHMYALNGDGTEKWSAELWAIAGSHLDPSGAIGEDGRLYVGVGEDSASVVAHADRLVAIGSPLPSAITSPVTPTPPTGPTRTPHWGPGWHTAAWA